MKGDVTIKKPSCGLYHRKEEKAMLENGWLNNLDEDYAEYCGENEPINKLEDDDPRFQEFLDDKGLWYAFALDRYGCAYHKYREDDFSPEAVAFHKGCLMQMVEEMIQKMVDEIPEVADKVAEFIREKHGAEFNNWMREGQA